MSKLLEEHLEYLSLDGRQARYEEALARAVEPGDVVADLGCGFGILGILALRAGADRVYGIDESDAIEIARQTVGNLNLTDRYRCIRGSTFRTQLPELVDLLVCDHVGYFGFDYDVVSTLADARRRMLKPNGKVVPSSLRLMVGAATGDCKDKVVGWTKNPVPPEYQWVKERALNSKYAYSFEPHELASSPVCLGEISLERDTPDVISFEATLEMDRDCNFEGLACWFECELAADVWMTNSPLAKDRINRPNAFLPCREPFKLKAGDAVNIELQITHEPVTISWTIRNPVTGDELRHSTWASMVLNPSELLDEESQPSELGLKGLARKTILSLLDGSHSIKQIEQIVLDKHSDLYPSEAEIRRFVRHEIRDNTRC